MKKTWAIVFFIILQAVLLSFFKGPQPGAKKAVKDFYVSAFRTLTSSLKTLKEAVWTNESEKHIRQKFLQSRQAYKQIEFILEYYYELDVTKINGPPIDFVEEEDPLAFHEPQGFQVIEAMLYPDYDTANKKALLASVDKLSALTNGLSNNAANFDPDDYLLDATMEEIYRILALGITGFDSPSGHLSMYEAVSSLNSVRVVINAYRTEMSAAGLRDINKPLGIIKKAGKYLTQHHDFDSFNRMEFILSYLNPLADWLGHAKSKMGYADNPNRYALVKKTASLFAVESLQRNRYLYDDTITPARITLGRKLFFETRLSKNGKRSCAGCHQPSKAFTDGLPKANQIDEHATLPRNTPTLWNAALQLNLFYDSRQRSLDHVITEVLSNEKEMNSGKDTAASNLKNSADYRELYNQAYPAAAGVIEGGKIVNAIAMYLRTIVSYNSRFDQYMRGKRSAMQPGEVKGFNLFMGKALCATCHFIPLFNGSKPPLYYYQESEVIGVPKTADTLHPVLDDDPGRYAIVKKEFLRHSFKTPTLRNIALTAPYMHNGVFTSLEAVVEFYTLGGGNGLNIDLDNQTLPFDKLPLSDEDQKNIVSFLKTLTDTTILKNDW